MTVSNAARGGSRRAIWSWALFDWANSPYPTIVTTFVFSAYFAKAVAENETVGTAQWGWAMGLAGLVIAVLAPLVGAVADHSGRRKPWLAAFSMLTIIATAGLWFIAPTPAHVLPALLLVGVSAIAFEMGMVFYNAMLPDVAPRAWLGRVSGWGWGLGYAGGLAVLVVALVGLVQADPPPFGLDKALQEPVRATALVVALWFAVFSLPLFLWTPDAPKREPLRRALRHGLADLRRLGPTLRAHPTILRFLIARMIYTDGLNTLFAFGGIYAAGTFGMDFAEIILLGIGMNVTAGLGAFVFGWMDDKIGAKPTILLALVCLMVLGAGTLVVQDKLWFWALALPIGLFVGPVQSASRSLMARVAPAECRTEMFGLYALSGKITAFAGPLLLAWATAVADSQRAGMATILVLLFAGFWLLRPLRVE